TSTRLQVERIAPSATPWSPTSRWSAVSSRPLAKATRSRTSTGAEWWLRPTRMMPRSTSEGLPVLAQGQHVHADQGEDDDRDPRVGELRRPSALPARRHAALEEHHVDAPGDEREDELRVRRPEATPGGVRPHDPRDDAEGQQDEAPDEAGVVDPVERLESGQVAERAAAAVRLQPPLLHEVEEARAEGEREDRVTQ